LKITDGISARQIKAARALLDWSQEQLAEACGLSVATIRKLEAGNISPRGSTNKQIRHAFQKAGLEFIEPGGVRHRPQEITILEGDEGTQIFYDDVYDYANKVGGDIIVVCSNPDAIYLKGDYKEMHIKRMCAAMPKFAVKCLITDKKISTPAAAYCEYAYMPNNFFASIPFYVYGNKSSFRITTKEGLQRIIVIESGELAEAFYQQFNSLWEKAIPIDTSHLKTREPKKR